MRKFIFLIVEPSENNNRLSQIYDWFMLIVIVASLVPLTIKAQTPLLLAVDRIIVTIFIIDYIFRWISADYEIEGKSKFLLF